MKFYPFKNILFNCRQATLLIIKKSERPLTIRERIKLFYHLLFCDPCNNFSKQSPMIDQLLHHCSEHLAGHPSHSLSAEARKKINDAFNALH